VKTFLNIACWVAGALIGVLFYSPVWDYGFVPFYDAARGAFGAVGWDMPETLNPLLKLLFVPLLVLLVAFLLRALFGLVGEGESKEGGTRQ
jgi:hypothetical protein